MLCERGTVKLETPRLVLRRFVSTDAPMMFCNWASSEAVTRYVTWFAHRDVQETQGIVDRWVGQYEEPHRYQWAIVLKETNEPIGSIGVVRMDADAESCEIGYCIGEAYWSKGITSEALQAVLHFLFEQVGFHRVAARHDIRNPRSGKVMKRCGMTYEGTCRDIGFTKEGDRLTLCLYAVLKSECGRDGKCGCSQSDEGEVGLSS